MAGLVARGQVLFARAAAAALPGSSSPLLWGPLSLEAAAPAGDGLLPA